MTCPNFIQKTFTGGSKTIKFVKSLNLSTIKITVFILKNILNGFKLNSLIIQMHTYNSKNLVLIVVNENVVHRHCNVS